MPILIQQNCCETTVIRPKTLFTDSAFKNFSKFYLSHNFETLYSKPFLKLILFLLVQILLLQGPNIKISVFITMIVIFHGK